MNLEESRITVNYSYPDNMDWEYTAHMERIDFDKECALDIETGNGFIIAPPKTTIKKDIKDPDGIFSPKFGQKLGDLNPFIDRYSCECGNLKSRINNGIECPICHTKCKSVGDNFKMFGWIKLKPEYPIIHPDIYVNLDSFFGRSKYDKKSRNREKGSKLRNIIEYDIPIDLNGNESELISIEKPDEPFFGKGMIYFYNHFDEIMHYYYQKNPKKKELYDDIMKDREKVFTHSLPVFTTHLRPMDISSGSMYFERCTAIYNMMVKEAHHVNRTDTKANRTPKVKAQELFKLQMKFNELYTEVVQILNGKRGQLRMLVGGRYNFSARCVIRQEPSLRIDYIKLPYKALVIILKAQIENLLHRMYNISFQEAYDRWERSLDKIDPIILKILNSLIEHGHVNPETGETEPGIPFIINRNPTINYGSIIQVFCVGINLNDFTMAISLQVLKGLGADFDGDVLNIMLLINQAFYIRAYQIFNPRNCMYISRSNGMCNKDVLPQRDTLINSNTIVGLVKDKYSQDDLKMITKLLDINQTNPVH